jgi:polyhydroxybutyrate depolymerase
VVALTHRLTHIPTQIVRRSPVRGAAIVLVLAALGVVSGGRSPVASGLADVVVGDDRPVTVHVPSGYDRSHPAPLLIGLHGYGGAGEKVDAYFSLAGLARQRGYLYALPDGPLDSIGKRFWNATDACCDFDRSNVDDAGYLDGVIKAIRAKLAVDPKRIYLIGHSNGGFMVHAMACAHSDEIAAIVSIAGATFADPGKCSPSVPVAVLHVHGTADNTIAYDGGTIQGLGSGQRMAPYPGAETTVGTWATYDGCATKTVLDERLDVDADVPDAETSVTRWQGCRPGGAVELWTVTGGGHGPNLTNAFREAVMDYVAAHSKP